MYGQVLSKKSFADPGRIEFADLELILITFAGSFVCTGSLIF